jgi:hypothetical protein
LHPQRFAVGSAVNQTARQVGGAVGVAILVVILGAPHSVTAALSSFHHLWWFVAAMTASSGLVCCLLRPALANRGAAVPVDVVAGEPTAMAPGTEGLA